MRKHRELAVYGPIEIRLFLRNINERTRDLANIESYPAKPASRWLKNQKVKVLNCCTQGANLNPIETFWQDLKQADYAHNPGENVRELEQFSLEDWAKMPPPHPERQIDCP